MADQSQHDDLLGLRPAAEALKAAVETASDFVRRICGPAADELGLLVRDRVSYWRLSNAVRLLDKAKKRIGPLLASSGITTAHPRLAMRVLEQGSWNDDDGVQEMWAGLLASSMSPDGKDDSNLIFITLLEQLTTAEAHFLKWVSETAPKVRTDSGVIAAEWVHFKVSELQKLTGISEIHRLDRNMDHLRALQLIDGGVPLHHAAPGHEVTVSVRPTGLGLNLYVRCQGSLAAPLEFFHLEAPDGAA